MDDLYRSTEKDLDQIGKISDGGHPGFPKFVVWGVSTFCLLVIVVLFSQMQSNLTIIYPQIAGSNIDELDLNTSKSLLELEDDQLRAQDSDGDGLSDYDELRIYGSSAYIADTDSDGLTDLQEINAGEDPNCPTGQNCFGGTELADNQEVASPYETEEVKQVLNDPAAIRQLLIDGGANPLLVNQLDDQTLQVLAKEAFDGLSNPTEEKLELLQNLSPEEIRTVLQYGGVEKQVLDALSDEELAELYQQSLSIHTVNQ